MKNSFIQKLASNGIELTEKQLEQLEKYYELLVEWNEKMNLTAITEKDAVYKKHFYDSLTPTNTFDFTAINTVCDVGSGAGFPSFVLKIVFPHLQITIVEALEKRIKFLQEVVEVLELEDVTLEHARAEEYGRSHREAFDVVTARAVARLPLLCELCIPMVKRNGTFIVLKGEQGEIELNEASKAVHVLGITKIEKDIFFLEDEEDKRVILFLKKGKLTPEKYPRNFGKIKSNPL